jgi:hypothetical protein
MPLEKITGILDQINDFASIGDEYALRTFIEPQVPGCRLENWDSSFLIESVTEPASATA